jgi:hypothetical protein
MKNPIWTYIIGVFAAYLFSKAGFNDPVLGGFFLFLFIMAWGFNFNRDLKAYREEMQQKSKEVKKPKE